MHTYLGLDSSTQGIKALIIDPDSGEILHIEEVNFGRELPQYNCPEGFIVDPENPLLAHSSPLLWVAALDLLLDKLQAAAAPMNTIAGISGSGQQHGSVYLNKKFSAALSSMQAGQSLAEQISPALARPTSPIWLDRSTAVECQELNDKFGAEILRRTGSAAIERFTGPQIRKFYKTEPEAYAATEIIHLVSSFMCSVLCGASAGIDYGDGAGMNLLNLDSLDWDRDICEFTAPGLLSKLPAATPSTTIAGKLHPYFAKYGLTPGIPVAAWSGDNPCSLVGVGASGSGTAAISLGTSDTLFAAMESFKTDPDECGHIFGNPAGGFMSLTCFTNGSLARDKVRDRLNLDWQEFDRLANDSEPGNNGNMMLPYFAPESTPPTLKPKVVYHGTEDFRDGNAAPSEYVRAILESQALSMKLHSGWIGDGFAGIRITGGASQCGSFCQIIADVFQAPARTLSSSQSAGLGAALIAAAACGKYKLPELEDKFCQTVKEYKPNAAYVEIYRQALEDYRNLEAI